MLKNILQKKFRGGVDGFLDELSEWRLMVTRYEQRMERPIGEEIKTFVLLDNAPDAIKKHLQLEVERDSLTAEDVMARIIAYIQLNTNYESKKNKPGKDGDGMDVDQQSIAAVAGKNGDKGKEQGDRKGNTK